MPSPITSTRSPGNGGDFSSPRKTTDVGSVSAASTRDTSGSSRCTSRAGTTTWSLAPPSRVKPSSSYVSQVFVAPTRQRRAAAARDDALGDDAIARRDAPDAIADGLDDSRPLVPERERVAHVGRVDLSAPELEVGAAQTAGSRLDDDLARSGNEHLALDEPDLARPVDDERTPHVGTRSPGAPSSAEMRPACSRVAPPSSRRRESGRSSRRPVTLIAPAQPPV